MCERGRELVYEGGGQFVCDGGRELVCGGGRDLVREIWRDLLRERETCITVTDSGLGWLAQRIFIGRFAARA